MTLKPTLLSAFAVACCALLPPAVVAQDATAVRITPYADVGATYSEDKRNESPSETTSRQLTAGFDLSLTSWLEIGAGGTVGDGDTKHLPGPVLNLAGAVNPTTTQIIGGESRSESWSAFGRVTINLPINVSFGVVAGYGESESEDSRDVRFVENFAFAGRQSWTRDSDSKFVSGSLNYTHRWNTGFLMPGARLLYSDTHGGAYDVLTQIFVNEGNNVQLAAVSASDDDLVRGQLGTDVGFYFQNGTSTIVPILRAYWAHDFDLNDGFRDRDAADLSASLNIIDGALTLGGEIQTTLGRDETETYGGRGYLLYKF